MWVFEPYIEFQYWFLCESSGGGLNLGHICTSACHLGDAVSKWDCFISSAACVLKE